MMNIRGGDDDGDISTRSLGGDILCQILSRSSVKSLMRFKCVCKRWQFLIEKDPYFIQLHLSQSGKRPALLISTTLDDQDDATYFFLAEDLFKGGAADYKVMTSWSCQRMLQPVNGLICFFEFNEGAALIYNLSTREVIPWIKIPINKKQKEEQEEEVKYDGVEAYRQRISYLPWYGFGFDPATKEHKVLCMWDKMRCKISPAGDTSSPESIDPVCEVLTVGHNTWRRIDGVPPHNMHDEPIYVNGSIYWLSSTCHRDQQPSPMDGVIIAFDVGSEKFRLIQIPSYICDNISWNLFPSQWHVNLLEVDGRIALSRPTVNAETNETTIKLWIFDDDDKEKISNWIGETISMSFDKIQVLGPFASFQAIAQRGDLIMIKPANPMNMFSMFSIYFYDRKKKTSKKVEFTTNRYEASKEPWYSYEIFPFVESLWPIQKQLQWHHPSQAQP